MKNIEDRIARYPELPPAEREAVDAYVVDHPQWAALLDEVKALEHLFEQARALGTDVPDDEALAHFLATPRAGALPPTLDEAFDEIQAALEDANQGAALRERCAALARRLRTLDAESRDAAAHFEALTGHAFETDDAGSASGARNEPSPGTVSHSGGSHRGARLLALLRLAVLPRWVRYAVGAVLALAVGYGALFSASHFSQSPMERLAAVDEDRLSVEGYGVRGMRTRGGGAAADSASLDRRYLRSLRLLRAARTTTLGLFPRYDAEQLRRAERQLEAVAQQAEAGSFVQLEALFFLGKARLAQGDKAGATAALRQVVTGGGRLAPEAQRILAALYEDAAYDGPPGG